MMMKRGGQANMRNLVITGIWLGEHRINQIGDDCANTALDEWKRRRKG